jgi:hypothetical protein
LSTLAEDYPLERVFNMDETAWHLYMGPHKVLPEKGVEAVKLKTGRSEKESFSAFGAICADGSKLPLSIITRGRTSRSHAKFRDHEEGDVRITDSENGWCTEDVMVAYLERIHHDAAHRFPCALVLDVYPSHRTARVQQRAEELDIELLFVPAGATGRLQPLDRQIFGELKSRARCEFQRRLASAGGCEADYNMATEVLCKC